MGFSATLKSVLDTTFGGLAGTTRQSATDALETALLGDAWSIVGVAIGFQNGWTNLGGAHNGAAYMKDALGWVHLRGVVAGGSLATMFQLPAGYRPGPANCMFTAGANNSTCRIDIGTDGSVVPLAYATGGSNAFVSLDNISFRASA